MNVPPRVISFLFPADSGRWLALLRVGLGLELIFYLLSLRRDWEPLLGRLAPGAFSSGVGEAITFVQSPVIPRVGWIVWLFQHFDLNEHVALLAIWWSLLFAAALLILGLFSRPIVILAWVLQLACSKSSGLLSYGADNFITIGLFYCMIAPLPDRWSFDHFLRPRPLQDLHSLGFHRRVLQLHLCLIYFFGGLSKCAGVGWWDGSNLWRSLTIPPFDVIPADWIAGFGVLLPVLGISVCLLETSYPFLVWWQRTRRLALYGICAMHGAIALCMGMYLFSGIMLVLNLATFWPNEKRSLAIPAQA